MRTIPITVLALLGGCDYEAPLNPFADPLANAIQGTVVLDGPDSGANAVVLAYAADNPGPPSGTGRPLTFTTITADQFTGAGGVQSAPFTLTSVPDGSYIITALLDIDGDFNPLASGLGGATCGDWVGLHAEALGEALPAVVSVDGGVLQDEITVLVNTAIGLERPAHTIVGDVELSKQLGRDSAADPTAIQLFRLRATGVHTNYAPLTSQVVAPTDQPLDLAGPCPLEDAFTQDLCDASITSCHCEGDALNPCETAFWVWVVDQYCDSDPVGAPGTQDLFCDTGDGFPDAYPSELQAAAGIRDIWPRVFLSWLGEPVTDPVTGITEYTEANLSVTDNVLQPPDADYPFPERYAAEAYPLLTETALGLLPSVGPIGAPFPLTELSVTWSPVVRHYHRGGTDGEDANGKFDLIDLRDPTRELDELPSGAWGITVISFTGQTWVLPNEIGLSGLQSTDAAFEPSKQAGVLQVVE